MKAQCCMMENNGISVVILDQILFHGNWCVLWIATCVGVGHDTDTNGGGGDLAVGDEKYFELGFGRNKLFQVLMYEETQL